MSLSFCSSTQCPSFFSSALVAFILSFPQDQSLHIQCILGNAHELSFNIVKVTAALMAALAAIAPVVEAGNCTPGLYYCGHTLMRYGKQLFGVQTDS